MNHGKRAWGAALGIAALAGFALPSPAQTSAYLTHRGNNKRDGWNPNEVILKHTNVTSSKFGKLWTRNVDGQVYAQPLAMPQVDIPGRGMHNVLFVATSHNTVYAFDADSASAPNDTPLWQVSLGPSVPYSALSCGDVQGPEFGIAGTPVIDPATGTLYVVAKTYESSLYIQRLHALDVHTGASRPGYPVVIQGDVAGNGGGSSGGRVPFVAQRQNQRGGLTLHNGVVYITFGSHCDFWLGEYHGWIFGYQTANPTAPPYILCTTPEQSAGPFTEAAAGIWMSGSGLAVDSNNFLYFETGNGLMNADLQPDGVHYGRNLGNSFVKVPLDLNFAAKTGSAFNYFTPSNERDLDAADADIGSSGITVVDHPGSTTPRLLIGGGKDGVVRLLNRDNLGGFNGRAHSTNSGIPPGAENVVQNVSGRQGAWSTTGYYISALGPMVIYSGANEGLREYNLVINASTGNSQLTNRATGPQGGYPCSTVAIATNGSAAGTDIAWFLNRRNNTLYAVRADNIAVTLWTSQQNAARDALPGSVVKFGVPTPVNGRVYAASGINSEGFKVSSYGLLKPWDTNDDGNTDDLDLGLVLASQGQCVGDAGFNPRADLNYDGCCDDLDLGVVLAHQGE